MNTSEMKIWNYFKNKKLEIVKNPKINISGTLKELDLKVNIDGWVFIEVTNSNLSDKGKYSLSRGIAVFGKPWRFHNIVKNEYKDHLKNSNLINPAVIIVDTEGSELSEPISNFHLESVNFNGMPELSAVVNYNKVHINYGRSVGLVRTNPMAKYQLSERQEELLSFM